MSDFDDLVRNDRSGESRSDRTTGASGGAGGASGGSTAKKSSGNSASVASMFGASDMAELSRRFNLDPDMNERVLVPLVNFLEKYGVADAVDSSPTANRLLSLAEFWNDIAPVIKNASDFFGGRKNQLDDSDREFLERIRAAQNETADLSLFQSDSDSESSAAGGSATSGISIGESVGSAPLPPPEASAPAPAPPKDPFKEPASVDWYEMMGAPNPANSKNHYETSALHTRPQTQFGINGLEQLAREAGLSVDEVMERDSQNKINKKASDGVDYTAEGGIPNFQQGIDKIQSQMAAEAEHHRRNSKVSFEDLPTPESAETYNPLAVEGLPSLTGGGLESVDSLAAKAGVNPEELKPQPVGSRDPEPEEVSLEEIEEAHSIPEVSVPVSPAQPSAETFLVNFDEYEVADE